MKPYEKLRPNYVREWLEEKKKKWKALMDDRIEQARRQGLLPEETKVEVRLSTKDRLKELGINVGLDDNVSLGSDNLSAGGLDFDVEALDSQNEEDEKEEDSS